MAERAGKNFLLQVTDGAGGYITVGGLQSASLSSTVDLIEVTNHGSNENKEYLQGAGIDYISISGSGIATDEASFNTIVTAHRNKVQLDMRLHMDDAIPTTYTGNFMVASIEHSGEYNGNVTFSVTLESNGAITVT